MASKKCINGFARIFPTKCCGLKSPIQRNAFELYPVNLDNAMCAWGATFLSVQVPFLVSCLSARVETTFSRVGKTDAILAAAAAHHRLLWIHPFLDGNGRVTRLMSHAALLETLDTGAVWSIARGLARSNNSYKEHLTQCDLPRRNDLDGRGNLSEEALVAFTRFFLETCIDQVTFMESLMQPDRLRTRILLWVEEETRVDALPPKAGAVLEAILYRGELPRGDVAALLGQTPRHARRIVSELLSRGVLRSDGPRDPLTLAFPATLASRWMPGLFQSRRLMSEPRPSLFEHLVSDRRTSSDLILSHRLLAHPIIGSLPDNPLSTQSDGQLV